MHIDGAKRMVSFVPLTRRGAPNHGPIWDALFCAAAALLCVPGQYTQVLDQLGLQVIQSSQFQYYDAQRFGDENHISIKEIARYLAFIGTTAEDAERWRAWAAVYIDMDLDEHPNSSHAPFLQEAKTKARKCIKHNPNLVLRRIPHNSPGYYNPEATHSRTVHNSRPTAHQPEKSIIEAGPSAVILDDNPHTVANQPKTSTTEAGPSAITLQFGPDDKDTISLGDEDEPMGLA